MLADQCTYVSLTVDLWSDRRCRSFMGVTAHFIEGEVLDSAVLCCKKFEGMNIWDFTFTGFF